ncbi:DASH complex subunit Dad1-domain-containing protein [Xylogone sp. PMI_703]|nr:DASH complex subunit Dad1-domain-containing protein [Xylogone sp. PMI_703]
MASNPNKPPGTSSIAAPTSSGAEKSFFEQQRELLLKDIAISFEHVLANINKLNRSLEGVIAVGNEFSSVEALWSQFENVMAKDPDAENSNNEAGHDEGEDRGDDTTVTTIDEGHAR